nr:RNA-directed DNA polymerase, eukaryota, reverse transcriptase zinc-binding domain protein [Tanacetum cinerariifolium]
CFPSGEKVVVREVFVPTKGITALVEGDHSKALWWCNVVKGKYWSDWNSQSNRWWHLGSSLQGLSGGGNKVGILSFWVANCLPRFSSCFPRFSSYKDEPAWLARILSLFRLADAVNLEMFSDMAAMDSSVEGGSRLGGMVRVNESTNDINQFEMVNLPLR